MQAKDLTPSNKMYHHHACSGCTCFGGGFGSDGRRVVRVATGTGQLSDFTAMDTCHRDAALSAWANAKQLPLPPAACANDLVADVGSLSAAAWAQWQAAWFKAEAEANAQIGKPGGHQLPPKGAFPGGIVLTGGNKVGQAVLRDVLVACDATLAQTGVPCEWAVSVPEGNLSESGTYTVAGKTLRVGLAALQLRFRRDYLQCRGLSTAAGSALLD